MAAQTYCIIAHNWNFPLGILTVNVFDLASKPIAGRSSHVPPRSPALPLGQGDINLVCRLLLKMTELMVGHLSTRFQGMSLKEAFPWLTASWERGGTAGLMVLLLALFPAPAGSRPLSYCTRDPTPCSPSIPACTRPKT